MEEQQQKQQKQQASELTTLRQVLTQDRPLVLSTLQVKARKPARWNIPWSKVHLWSQFSLENVNRLGGEILDKPLTGLNDAIPNAFNVLDNLRLDYREDMFSLTNWIRDILSFSVPYAVSQWDWQVPGTLHFQVNEYKAAPFSDCFYSGIETPEGEWKGLMVGTHQPDSTWSIEKIRDHRGSTASIDSALGVLAYCCEKFNVTYGYILTLNELVVCQFAPYSNGMVKVMPIPLLDSGEGKMTAEMAIWALCVLALGGARSAPPAELAVSEDASNMSD